MAKNKNEMELQNMSDDSDHGFKNPIRKGGF